ncbi:MAG TPA: GAP family protein, partial [Actinomycetes bacterium]|nr:GAP family protein [Actinomycetes bacterium]
MIPSTAIVSGREEAKPMGAAIGDILGLAAGVAVSPLPIVAMILVLATPRGRVNGIVFGLGWVLGLAVLGAVVLALAGPADASDGGEPAAWTGWLKLLLGVLALLLAVRQWRGRPAPGSEPQMPKWMASIDRLKPGGAVGLGALLSAVNPKNGGLTIAAAATIAGTGLAGGEQAVVLAVFVLIGSAGVLAPLIVYLVAGEGAARTLDSWKAWAATHNAAVMAVLFLVFGFKLVGDGLAVLF